jgi:hypothetical protein
MNVEPMRNCADENINGVFYSYLIEFTGFANADFRV